MFIISTIRASTIMQYKQQYSPNVQQRTNMHRFKLEQHKVNWARLKINPS